MTTLRTPARKTPSAPSSMRMMDIDGAMRFPVFGGRHTWTLEVVPREREHLGHTAWRRGCVVELRTAHEGDLEQRGSSSCG